jgi:hypothetical protein
MSGRMFAVVVSVLAVSSLAGCGGEEVVGMWESDQKVAGKRHEFTLDNDLVGEGKFYLTTNDNQVVKCEADVEAKPTSREDKYDLELKFQGQCKSVADMEFECEIEKEGAVLDCDGTEFNRVEE